MKSSPIFVDTNVFLRFLTRDLPEQAERARTLFESAAAGRIELRTTELVLAELIWTLKSYYKLANRDIRVLAEGILDTPGITVENGHLVRTALRYCADHNIDFVDGYVVAFMQRHRIGSVFSFNKKHFGRITGIRRIEALPEESR